MKQFRVQVRTELYRTYSIWVNEDSNDEEVEMDQLIDKLDQILKEDKWDEREKKRSSGIDGQVDEVFSQFGGFMSIESKEPNGAYKQVLGEHYRR